MVQKKYDSSLIVKEYVGGASVKDLHKKYGIPCNYVHELANREGIFKKKDFKASHEKILELHSNGLSSKEIAKIVGFREDRIFNLLKEKTGLKKKIIIKKEAIDSKKDLIIQLFQEAKNITSIAEEFNVSRSFLEKRLRDWLGSEYQKIKKYRANCRQISSRKKEYKPRERKIKKDLSFEEKFSMKLAEKAYYMKYGGLSFLKIAEYFNLTVEQASYCVQAWVDHLKKP